MSIWDDEELFALGMVVEQGRGSLPFALVHGEALVAAAAWALGEAGVTPLDLSVSWDAVRDAGAPLVLHDSLCPMTPPLFIADCLREAVENDVVVVGVRAVTDTVKRVDAGPEGGLNSGHDAVVGVTLDRDELVTVCSPIVVPADVVAGLDRLPALDFAVLASVLGERHRVARVPAPSAARRVSSLDDVAVLEALTAHEALEHD